MPKTIQIPFTAVRFSLIGGGILQRPLSDHRNVQVGMEFPVFADRYRKALQKNLLDDGAYLPLVATMRPHDYKKDQIWVDFPASKQDNSFPAFDLAFDYYYSETEKGIWASVPTLFIEVFVTALDQLETQIKESIQLEFSRKRRLAAVHQIVPAIWYKATTLNHTELALKTYGPAELVEVNEKDKRTLLPVIGRKLQLKKQVLFGRKNELLQLSKLLKNSFGRNVLLVGPNGVGKTVLVWELARQRKALGISANIWETSASVMIKELTRDTGWQDNIVHLCKELKDNGDILYIRNFSELFEVGKYEGNQVSIAEFLRPFVSRGEIAILSECTREELARIELQSPNYSSFFQIIDIAEPSTELVNIIQKKVAAMAKSHRVDVNEIAIKEIIRLNRRYNPYAGFPGKPIRFLESIFINKRAIVDGTETSVKSRSKTLIAKSEVIKYFCEDSGMPAFMVDGNIPMDLEKIKRAFNQQVFGQVYAVEKLGDVLAAVKTAMNRSGKPIASFLFVGPTGVGKTELAKVLASFMFGHRDKMIRFDMSEYATPLAVMRMVGVGPEKDGLLTSAVRRSPFCVLLFDEIEKADPTFYDLLLQVLSEGRLTDSRGKLVNFCSTIIIMTSNIGAKRLQTSRIGWQKKQNKEDVTAHFRAAVEKHFRPELFNRIDQIIPFIPLTKEVVRFVVDREIQLFRKREGIQFRNMNLQIEDMVLDHLAELGYEPKFGARQLQRVLREQLISPLSKKLNIHDFEDQIEVIISLDKSEPNPSIQITIEEDFFGDDLLLEQWDKINFSDLTSQLRRKIARLKEGNFYVQLLSKLDVLEEQKRAAGKDFWKEQKKAEKYSHYLKTKDDVEKLAATIRDYEMNISLACMDLARYNTDFEEKLKQWEKDFFNLKISIYKHLHPLTDEVYLGIYGKEIQPVLNFYQSIIAKKNWEYSAQSIWFRESFYQQHKEGTKLIDGGIKQVQEADVYLKKIWEPIANFSPEPLMRQDLLVGVELCIVGSGANLYLKEEEGLQTWVDKEDLSQYFFIKTDNKSINTPEEIHRNDFYRLKNPRRKVEPLLIKDSSLKINQALKKRQLVAYMMSVLDKKFEQTIEELVV